VLPATLDALVFLKRRTMPLLDFFFLHGGTVTASIGSDARVDGRVGEMIALLHKSFAQKKVFSKDS
jgi:hypothetical protein